MDGLRSWVLTGKQFEDFRRKRPLNATIENGHCNQEQINRRKIEKKHSDQNYLNFAKLELKKASPDMFIFYVELAGHDMVTTTRRATTCRRNFKTQ